MAQMKEKANLVFVLDIEGNPLMPTHPARARKLLKQGKAKVKQTKPFVIQLTYDSERNVQPVTLGIDSGYLHIGFSAITEKRELICGELKMLVGMSERIAERASYRRVRRNRLRYRKCRFDNDSKSEGWLAPSVEHKLQTHYRFLGKLYALLPITKTIVEVANFDIQKIKNPNISGAEYQQGEQSGFWNLREYILHRDNHTCQNPDCKNKAEKPILQIHHIKYKSNGGQDIPSNLITLCTKCHTSANHKKGKFLYEWQETKQVKGFRDATFMSMVRWKLVHNIACDVTYGYETKSQRIALNLEKTHSNDAFCIAGGTTQTRSNPFEYKQVRRNNRSLEQFYDKVVIDVRTGEKVKAGTLDSGRRTRNKDSEKNGENLRKYRGETIKKGQRRIRKSRPFYQSNDLVRFEGNVYVVKGVITNGKYLKLHGLQKTPKVEDVQPYRFMKGMCC